MPGLRRAHPLLGVLFIIALAGMVTAREQNGEKNVMRLSIEDFTRLALTDSLRSRTSQDNFYSDRWGWVATRRELNWPTVDASASKTKNVTDDDLGLEADTRVNQGSLSLTQPLLTGTKLSVTGRWSRSETINNSLGSSTSSFNRNYPDFDASLTQPLFLFVGNLSLRSKRQADLEWANSKDRFQAEQLSIEFDARSRYYGLLVQMETTEVERKKFESAKLVNDVTQALVRAGKLAAVESVRSDIRAKKDLRRIQNSDNTLEKALNEAKDFLYIPSDTKIVLTSKLSYEPFKIPLETLLEEAYKFNPDLQISKRSVELSEISLKTTSEGDRPRLNATGNYSLTKDRSDDLAPLDPHSWSVGLGLEWPIFDATQTRLKTRQSVVALKNVERSLDNQGRQLRVNIENAYLEIKRTEDQIADFEPQRESARRNVNAIRLQYRNGLTRLTDVFDAENELRDLELEYLDLLIDFNKTRDLIRQLVGKDLTEMRKP